MFDQIAANKRRTWLLLLGFGLLIALVTAAVAFLFRLGTIGFAIAIVFAVATSWTSYWCSDRLALAAARAPHLAMVDADDVVATGWLAAMVTALDEAELVAGALEIDRLNPEWVRGTRGRALARSVGTFAGVLPFAHSSNLGVRRDLVDRIGGFDEGIEAGEDVEFSYRASRVGVVPRYAPDAVVHYRYRTEPEVLWQQGRRYGRSRPMVVKLLVARGLRRPPRFAGWRSWIWLVLHLPDLVRSERRAAYVWVAGNRLGQLEGSIRYRTVFL